MFPDYALINRKISAIPYLMRYLGRQEYRDLNSIGIDNAGNIKISYLCYQRPPLHKLDNGSNRRDDKWTKSIAVGSNTFIEEVNFLLGARANGRKTLKTAEGYQLREPSAP